MCLADRSEHPLITCVKDTSLMGRLLPLQSSLHSTNLTALSKLKKGLMMGLSVWQAVSGEVKTGIKVLSSA